jgi:hypothetical protein
MLSNSFVDVAIGIILMYVILSLVCTAINEFLATVLKWRAKILADGLAALVDDPKLRDLLFDHGVVAGPAAVAVGKSPLLGRLFKFLRSPGPSYIDPKNFATALLGALNPGKPLPGVDELKKLVSELEVDSNIKDALLASVSGAGSDITRVRDNLAQWFDSAMDRLSGAYKRKIHLVGFVIGSLLALACNADTFAAGQALWLDAGLRGQIAAMADKVSADPSFGSLGSVPADLPSRAEQNLRNLEEIHAFPLGWNESHGRPDYNWQQSTSGWIKKILGLAVTAFALSLGAPFWFDMLSSFVRLRGSGEPPVLATQAPQIEVSPHLRIVSQIGEAPETASAPVALPQPAELPARRAS